MKLKKKLYSFLVKIKNPRCRLDWVDKNRLMLTYPNGDRWLVEDDWYNWGWTEFAQKFVPATICLWSLILVSGVVLGCVYGTI